MFQLNSDTRSFLTTLSFVLLWLSLYLALLLPVGICPYTLLSTRLSEEPAVKIKGDKLSTDAADLARGNAKSHTAELTAAFKTDTLRGARGEGGIRKSLLC